MIVARHPGQGSPKPFLYLVVRRISQEGDGANSDARIDPEDASSMLTLADRNQCLAGLGNTSYPSLKSLRRLLRDPSLPSRLLTRDQSPFSKKEAEQRTCKQTQQGP